MHTAMNLLPRDLVLQQTRPVMPSARVNHLKPMICIIHLRARISGKPVPALLDRVFVRPHLHDLLVHCGDFVHSVRCCDLRLIQRLLQPLECAGHCVKVFLGR